MWKRKVISRNNLYSLSYALVTCLGLDKSIIRPVYNNNKGNKLMKHQPTVLGIVFFCGISHHSYHYTKTVIKNFRRIKTDQLDITCFIVSLFTAQHISNISTAIFRSLRLIVDLFHVLYCSGSMCVGVTVWFGWGGVVSLCRLKHCFSLHTDEWSSNINFHIS